MAEIGTAVASTIIERAVDAIIIRARYILQFNKFVADLRKSRRESEKTLQHVKEHAKEAITNAEKIVQPVEDWLNEVEKVLEDVQKLEERVEESQSCLNMTLQYSLAKEVINMTQQVNKLNNSNNKFEPFSHPIELSSMNYFFPKDFVELESRKKVHEKLLNAIQDDNSNVIGVVGMGGSGKTSLSRVVGKQVEESKLYDKVVMTVVSQDVNVRDIQGQIADHLTFSLMEETELGRALRLSQRLKTEKILIIFDDVWEKLDLEAIGIPLNENDKKKCCILVITRNQQVCASMNCQSMVELSALAQDEGWNLFKQRARIDDDSPQDFREVAKRVFDKCQGLLVAILTVGSSLKGKNLMTWELALSRLETNCQSLDVLEGLKSAYDCNELEEIICLDSKEAGQLRYLYAPSQPVFPKLWKILIKGCNKIRQILFPSIVSSLPELKELSLEDCSELVEIISSYSSEETGQFRNLSSPSQQVSFPKLAVIQIKRCDKLKTIFLATSISSLTELKELSVCECNNLEEIISSDSEAAQQHRDLFAPCQQIFPKLRRINIENCNKLKTFFSASVVKSLPELQQLIIKDCNEWEEIISYSEQLGNIPPFYQQACFPKLINVQIERCNKLKTIFNAAIVTCLPELKELIVKDCNQLVESISSDIEKAPQLGNQSAHSGQVCFPKLQKIEVESCKKFKAIFDATIVTSLPELEQLVIKDCNEWEEIISADSKEAPSKQAFFPRLRKIQIEKCNKLKAIFSTSIVTILPELEQLVVKDCNGWKEIISFDSEEAGELRNSSIPSKQVCFPKLRSVQIERCCKLKTIFSTSIVKILPELEQLVVKDCNEWEEIISLDSGQFRNLPAPSQQASFPRLTNIEIERCNKLKAIFSSAIVTRLPRLEQLSVEDCNEWKEIISLDSKEVRQARNLLLPPFQNNGFPQLRNVSIKRCNKLKTVFSMIISKSLPNLQYLVVKDCDEWEEIISFDSEEAGQARNLSAFSQKVCFPMLWNVDIERCNKLKAIFSATAITCLPELELLAIKDCNALEEIISFDSEETNLSVPSEQACFPKLKYIQIVECNKLKTIFNTSTVNSLPELRDLVIQGCNEWEEIISLDSGKDRDLFSPSKHIYFPKVQSIWIDSCNKLKTIFFITAIPILPDLQSLFVGNCDELKDIFSSCRMDAVPPRNQSPPSFPKLSSIGILRCSKLKRIFSTSIVSSLPELKRLDVLDCVELEEIISSDSYESEQICFPKIRSISIDRCNILKTIFSSTMVISLPELQSLQATDCNELVEIFSLNSEQIFSLNSEQAGQVCFPKLESIWIRSCNKLKFIFSYSMAHRHCPSLHFLDIESCCQLEDIVKFEHKAATSEKSDHEKHLLFPNLHVLGLRKLANLTGIPPLYESPCFLLSMEDCPSYMWSSVCTY